MRRIRPYFQALYESVREEKGSASVELVVFAIPLFVPLILLASHLTVVSASKVEIAHLARTSLRAFATAESTALGHARIGQVLATSASGAKNGMYKTSAEQQPEDLDTFIMGSGRRDSTYSYLIECEKFPCIQPLNRLKLTLRNDAIGTEIVVTTSTDTWIEAEQGYHRQDRNLLLGYRDVADLEQDLSPILEAKDLIGQVRDLISGR